MFSVRGCAFLNQDRRFLFNTLNEKVDIENTVLENLASIPAIPVSYAIVLYDDTLGSAITSFPSACHSCGWIWGYEPESSFPGIAVKHILLFPFQVVLTVLCFPPVYLYYAALPVDLHPETWPEKGRLEDLEAESIGEERGATEPTFGSE